MNQAHHGGSAALRQIRPTSRVQGFVCHYGHVSSLHGGASSCEPAIQRARCQLVLTASPRRVRPVADMMAVLSGVLAKALRFPLAANRASEEMGIDFADTIELGFYLSVFEAGAAECAPPKIRGEKTRIRSKFRIDLDVGKTIQDLKYQFRIHGLVEIGPYALTDYEAAIRRQRTTSLT